MKKLIDNLTVILVLYQEKEDVVIECLKNIKNFKIIIVDNDNDLALKKNILKDFEIYQYLTNEKNIGFTRAANIAINLAKTEYVLNLNETPRDIVLVFHALHVCLGESVQI